VTSGKGGVGKTNLVVNLAVVMAGFKKKVVVLDADMALANVDVLLNIKPRFTLRHVVSGEKELADIIINGPGGIKIIPASSGLPELADLSAAERGRFIEKLQVLEGEAEVLLIDTPAGVASNVMQFLCATRDTIVITTPEPTAITDAYAMVKLISLQNPESRIRLLVNMVSGEREAEELVRGIALIASRFLGKEVEYLGFVESDANLPEAVRRQQPVCVLYPESPASRAIRAVGARLCNWKSGDSDRNGVTRFFEKVLDGNRDGNGHGGGAW